MACSFLQYVFIRNTGEVAFYKNSQGFSFYIPVLTYTVYLFDIFYFPMTQALLKFA